MKSQKWKGDKKKTVKELKNLLNNYKDTDELWLDGGCDDAGYSWQALMIEDKEIISEGKEKF